MPLGLWKSKWEIHREDMERAREDMDRFREDMERSREDAIRRDAVYRDDMTRRDAEYHATRLRSDERWIELKEETRDLRIKYDRELVETRRFNREMLLRLEKTYENIGTALALLGDEVIAMRWEIHDLKSAVDAQTKAILRLVDRFEDTNGRPPV